MLPFQKESRQVRRKCERDNQKMSSLEDQQEKQVFYHVRHLLKTVFSAEEIGKIARETNFQQRQRTLTPSAVVGVLLIGCLNDDRSGPIPTLEGLCRLLRKWFDIRVQPQSLHERINCEAGTKFIKEIMTKLLTHKINKVFEKKFKKHTLPIKDINRILLQDSTVISLPECLEKIFGGCGGTASKAAVKCDFIINQSQGLIVGAKLLSGRKPDATLSNEIIKYLKKNDLVIRDLGYFNITKLKNICKKEAYFLSRLQKHVCVYLNEHDKQPLNFIEYLKTQTSHNKQVDIEVYVGKKERMLVRLIAIKVPEEVVEARRLKYNGKYKKDPSMALDDWNGFTIMITNIPKKKLSIKMLLKFYKIRWQIELFFKNVKSNLWSGKCRGTNKYRIQSLIYLKIILIWMTTILYAYTQNLVGSSREVSLFKFTRWLKEEDRLKKALITVDLLDLLHELKEDIPFLCKQKRNRKTTARDITSIYFKEQEQKKAA